MLQKFNAAFAALSTLFSYSLKYTRAMHYKPKLEKFNATSTALCFCTLCLQPAYLRWILKCVTLYREKK